MTPFEQGVLDRLDRMANALEWLASAAIPEQPQPVEGCQHPQESRMDLGGGEWECVLCKFRHTPFVAAIREGVEA